MAHFAKIDENGIVLRVSVCSDDQQGQSIRSKLGGTWVQTSYNTHAGKHRLGGVPLRKNYAAIGYLYDHTRDAFIPPKPFSSWTLDEETCSWNPPIPMPEDGRSYSWEEDQLNWVAQ